MSSVIIQSVLTLIGMIVPGANSPLIEQIIEALVKLVPVVIQEAKDLTPIVTGIIEQLRGNGNVTPAQLDKLDAMSDQIDAAFDASDAKAQAEDDAANASKT